MRCPKGSRTITGMGVMSAGIALLGIRCRRCPPNVDSEKRWPSQVHNTTQPCGGHDQRSGTLMTLGGLTTRNGHSSHGRTRQSAAGWRNEHRPTMLQCSPRPAVFRVATERWQPAVDGGARTKRSKLGPKTTPIHVGRLLYNKPCKAAEHGRGCLKTPSQLGVYGVHGRAGRRICVPVRKQTGCDLCVCRAADHALVGVEDLVGGMWNGIRCDDRTVLQEAVHLSHSSA